MRIRYGSFTQTLLKTKTLHYSGFQTIRSVLGGSIAEHQNLKLLGLLDGLLRVMYNGKMMDEFPVRTR